MQEERPRQTGDARRPQREEAATMLEPPAAAEPLTTAFRPAPVRGERIGKYVVDRLLGEGGMGVVVGARHEQLNERVAIKVLHPKAAKDAVQRERFVREARSTVRIKSEHVVRVLDAGVEEATGAPFIVMEYLEGQDLGELLAQSGPLPLGLAVDCIIQICEAVTAAHSLGIIHRDLKPSNFFMTRSADGGPNVKVLDFGISKAAAEDGLPDPRLTETQAVFGSPTYMSPEQIRSSKNADERSDVWSIGVALFELLTGKLPFVSDNVAGLLASVIADAPFRLTTFLPDAPLELEAIVHACLEKDPARRVGSAQELAVRLSPFASLEGAHLAARLQRTGRPSWQSFPPPAPSTSSAPNLRQPDSVPPHLPSAPFPPVAFGITGTELTKPSTIRLEREGTRARGFLVALLATTALLMLAAIGALTLRARDGARDASVPATKTVDLTPPIVPSSMPPAPTEALPALPIAPVASALTSAAPPATATAPLPAMAKRPKAAPSVPVARAPLPGQAAAGPAASHPAAAPVPPPPAPSANLDSRF